MTSERVGIFIDGPNLYGGAKRLTGNGGVDIRALGTWIAQGRNIAELVFWTGQLKQEVNVTTYAGQQRLFASIEQNIPNARIGRAHLVKRFGRWVEKGVDVGVALDLVIGAYEDRWDVGVAVTGDGDLARAGSLVRSMGKQFEVAYCEGSLSGLLKAEASSLRKLDAVTVQSLLY